MLLFFLLLGLSVVLSGPFRAIHEAPSHDADCGVNAWAKKHFEHSRPKLWRWLDSRYSHLNKYRMAKGKPAWVGKLLKGPLVSLTDLWHASYTVSNIAGNAALFLALSYAHEPLHWAIAAGIVLAEDVTFEPVYRLLRNYKPAQ